MKLRELTEPIVAVIHLPHQLPHVIHQVTLDPAKIVNREGQVPIIRVGDFPGDEANGWQFLDTLEVIHVIGRATYDAEKKQLNVTPYAVE